MKVNEVFYSLSGEGIHVGIPTVFIRLAGCNLNCTYCDTQYASDSKDGREMDVAEVMSEVRGFKHDGWVLITGGNPLYQVEEVHKLLFRLKNANYKVEVEENGSIDPPFWFSDVDCWSVDIKCPSSGPSYGTFRRRWLTRMRKRDQLKFVVGTQEDLDFVGGFLSNVTLKPTILVSPIASILLNKKEGVIEEYWNRKWLQEVTDFCKGQNVRMSLQLHKIVYGDKKGV